MKNLQLTPELVQQIESVLNRGNRVELLVEQGRIVVVEVKRKLRARGE